MLSATSRLVSTKQHTGHIDKRNMNQDCQQSLQPMQNTAQETKDGAGHCMQDQEGAQSCSLMLSATCPRHVATTCFQTALVWL